MFSFGNRNKLNAVRDLFNRIANVSTPNHSPFEGDTREENRMNRTLPVVLAVWEQNRPVSDEAMTVVTKDLSDRGLSVIMRQPLRVDQIVVGFWLWRDPTDESQGGDPSFVLGNVRQNFQIGGGFWQVGIETTQVLSSTTFSDLERLIPLVEQLVPKHTPADELPTAASVR